MKHFLKRHYIGSMIVSFVVGIAITIGISAGIIFSRFGKINFFDPNLDKIISSYSVIKSNYYRKPVDSQLSKGAINGMLKTLNDPFSDYLTGTDASSLNDTVSASFGGVGLQVINSDDQIKIMATIANTPAAKAGIKSNDIIKAVNGKSIKGKSISNVTKLMRGKVGTKVTITIQRQGSTFSKTLTRAKIPVKTVNYTLNNHHIGYISISTVSTGTSSELKSAIKKLKSKGAHRLIIDVRNNPGGLMDEALKMASMFLKNGKTIMQTKDRSGQSVTYKASKNLDGGYKVTLPTVVVINGESASAAEIFAAALNQSANIPLIGSKSFGKGTVQTVMDYGDQSELKLTIAKWLTPNGSWIHHKGLKTNYQSDYPQMAYLPPFNQNKTYQLNDADQDIYNLEVALHDLGYYKQQPSDRFTAAFKTAVKQYQDKRDLVINGTIDKATMKRIEADIITNISKKDPALKKAQSIVGELK